jgi:hypothetical protein
MTSQCRRICHLALLMNVLLDTVSTSDADERELLQAANSTLYWERVTARSGLASSDLQVGEMEDVMAGEGSLVRSSDVIA